MANQILIETSARHVHLKQEDIETLFGKGYELKFKKELSQPGQFACEERVDVIGPKKEIKNIIILGPARKATQVEVSLSDARTLGLDAPVRESGDVGGSAPCKIVGPNGSVEITEGVIVAKRHIHLDPKTALNFGLKDKQIVCVKVESNGRKNIFGDVVIRVNESFAPAMHIDTDESNAAGCTPGIKGDIITDLCI